MKLIKLSNKNKLLITNFEISERKKLVTNYNFYYTKNIIPKFGRYFNNIEDRKKLLDFLDIDYNDFVLDKMYIKNEEIIKNIDYMVKRFVMLNPYQFIYDKYLKDFALKYLELEMLKNHINQIKIKDGKTKIILDENNNIRNIVVEDFHVSSKDGSYQINMKHLLSNSSKDIFKKLPKQKNQKNLFYKDIIALIIKIIKENTNEKYLNIDFKKELLKKEQKITESSSKYIDIMIDVINNQKFYKKRTLKESKRLNKTNFQTIFATFIKEKVVNTKEDSGKITADFFAEMKKYKNNDFKIEFCEKDINFFFRLIKNKVNMNILNGTMINTMFSKQLVFNNIEEYKKMFEVYAKENQNVSIDLRMLNAKKNLSNSTKVLLKKHKSDMEIIKHLSASQEIETRYFSVKNNLINEIIFMIETFKKIGLSEKQIRIYINQILNINNYLYVSDKLNEDENRIHDILTTLQGKYKALLKKLLRIKNLNHNFFNSVFRLCFILELNEDNIPKIEKTLNSLLLNLPLFKEMKPIKNLKEIAEKITLEKETLKIESIRVITKKLKIEGIEENIKIASKMGALLNYELLLAKLTGKEYRNSFFEKPIFPNMEENFNKYKILISNHQHGIGLLGANVSGVCISAYGNHRLSQINKNFLNLCIYNEEKGIMIWGLICLANDGKENFFILNNLQGALPSTINKNEVKENIETILKKYIEQENVKNIIFLNLGFNGIKLTQENHFEVLNSNIHINIPIRIDFPINQEGKLLHENRYKNYDDELCIEPVRYYSLNKMNI